MLLLQLVHRLFHEDCPSLAVWPYALSRNYTRLHFLILVECDDIVCDDFGQVIEHIACEEPFLAKCEQAVLEETEHVSLIHQKLDVLRTLQQNRIKHLEHFGEK